MEKPEISVREDSLVLINQRSRHLAMFVDKDSSPLKSLICSFLENDQNLYAAVIAPQQDSKHLAHRVVSFLSAYMRIEDADALEAEVLGCIETCLRRHQR